MASGGVENEPLDTDICNCTICLEIFKVPKILPCLHTFCQTCLNSYILSTNGEKSQPGHFLCPVCRTKVIIPDPKTPVSEWAKLMPLNNTIASLIDGLSIDQVENEKKCDPCERHGESTQGQFWCFECQENLCELCQKYHTRVKLAAGHKIIPMNELKKEDLGIRLADVEEPCFEHKGEFLKVYCVDHQAMCCVLCLSIDHRKCENIKTLDQMAENWRKSDEAQTLAETMKTFGQKMGQLIAKKEENIEGIEQQKEDILEDVVKTIEQAKEKLDKCHEVFKIHMSQTHKEQNTKLVDMKDTFEIIQKSVENCEKLFQTVLKFGSPKQMFMTYEKIKARLHVQMGELHELLQKDVDKAYNINIDKHLTAINDAMQSIAELQLKETESNKSTLSAGGFLWIGNKDALLQHQLKTADIDDLEAVKLWDIEGEGWYKDAIFLENDALLCVDFENHVLQVYDNVGHLLFAHSLDYKPWGLAQSSDGKIFVSDSTSPGIRIYTLGQQTLQQTNFISTKEKPYALGILQDNIVVTQQRSITSFNQNGVQRNEIGRCHENSFVAVSKTDKSSFYCCDGDCVVNYTLDGNEMMRHKLPNIKAARGVAVDSAGNIYVCGSVSRNVLIFSKDGMSSRIFLSKEDDIFHPYSIGFNNTGTKFFLTSNNIRAFAVFRLGLKIRH